MELTKKGIEKRIEIKNDFVWYHFKNKKLDFSKIISIGGNVDLQGCSADLSSLVSIGGSAHLQGCSADLSSLVSIGDYAYLQGCSADLSSLVSIGGFAYLYGCSADLSSLKSISGYAYLQGCSKKLKKSLAKTLQKCAGIYVEFQDNSMTLDEFKKYADKL